MESVKHQIEYKRLDEIRPYDNNPQRNDEAAKAVANSIREFGFQSPIIVDRDGVIIVDRDGVIIAGHTRYKAARRLKLQEVPATTGSCAATAPARRTWSSSWTASWPTCCSPTRPTT